MFDKKKVFVAFFLIILINLIPAKSISNDIGVQPSMYTTQYENKNAPIKEYCDNIFCRVNLFDFFCGGYDVIYQCNDLNYPQECCIEEYGVPICLAENVNCYQYCCLRQPCDTYDDFRFCYKGYVANCNVYDEKHNTNMACCPIDYPVFNERTQTCWKKDWECVSNEDCKPYKNICINHKCYECINDGDCPENYICENYQCKECVPNANMNGMCYYSCADTITCPNCKITSNNNGICVLWNGNNERIDDVIENYKDRVDIIWFYDGCRWYSYIPNEPDLNDLEYLTNNYCYVFYVNDDIQLGNVSGSLEIILIGILNSIYKLFMYGLGYII